MPQLRGSELLALPAAVGVKARLMAQLLPGASEVLQVVLTKLNGAVRVPTVSGCSVISALVRVTVAKLLRPTPISLNETKLGVLTRPALSFQLPPIGPR